MATGVGGPIGMALVAAGADAIIQKATTGEVNWGQVAVSGAFGLVGGGLATAIGRHAVGNAAEGALESVAQYAVSGQPLTVEGFLSTAASGAALSAATGGALSKVDVPTPTAKLGDQPPTPVNVVPSSGNTFVVTPNGTTYDIPAGWPLREADNGRGLVAQHPNHLAVGNGKENEIRIMQPDTKNPDGYSRYSNVNGQYLDPRAGKPSNNPNTHVLTTHQGTYLGWPQ
ncbi:hypothetical protein [Klugiella xanthotipulae]|uniref:hypothetical protein n=1 Tax=Klugiella xanthotipulae TaxID=244735 RepID=UPI00114FE106|nr:hypothetical protein [Klugiella xanthotipulae]